MSGDKKQSKSKTGQGYIQPWLEEEIKYLEIVWIPFLEARLHGALEQLQRLKKAQTDGTSIQRRGV
jgi:hypothetical protein